MREESYPNRALRELKAPSPLALPDAESVRQSLDILSASHWTFLYEQYLKRWVVYRCEPLIPEFLSPGARIWMLSLERADDTGDDPSAVFESAESPLRGVLRGAFGEVWFPSTRCFSFQDQGFLDDASSRVCTQLTCTLTRLDPVRGLWAELRLAVACAVGPDADVHQWNIFRRALSADWEHASVLSSGREADRARAKRRLREALAKFGSATVDESIAHLSFPLTGDEVEQLLGALRMAPEVEREARLVWERYARDRDPSAVPALCPAALVVTTVARGAPYPDQWEIEAERVQVTSSAFRFLVEQERFKGEVDREALRVLLDGLLPLARSLDGLDERWAALAALAQTHGAFLTV